MPDAGGAMNEDKLHVVILLSLLAVGLLSICLMVWDGYEKARFGCIAETRSPEICK